MDTPLVIACGALARELRTVLDAAGLRDQVEVRYLPAHLHNRPEGIVPAVRHALEDAGALDPDGDRSVLIGYADCGTGGRLDALLEQLPHLRRLPGAHCYELFAGSELFEALHDREPGTFYLTDFLARHFEALVWQGLGLDRHPELRDVYFANYRRLVLLSQAQDDGVIERAQHAAARLGLAFEHRHVGYGHFAEAVAVSVRRAA